MRAAVSGKLCIEQSCHLLLTNARYADQIRSREAAPNTTHLSRLHSCSMTRDFEEFPEDSDVRDLPWS